MNKIEIKPLTMKEALDLYNLIGKYLPDDIIDVLEYHNSIVNKIIADSNPEAYAKALELMSKMSILELLSLSKYEHTSLFIDCIVANQLWVLKDWLEKIGYGTSNG